MKEMQENVFYELRREEMELINGGGPWAALSAIGGGLPLHVPFIPLGCVVAGVGAAKLLNIK